MSQIEQISMKIFGTTDYKTMLAILAPCDGMVKEFNKEVNKLKQEDIA